MHRILIVDDHPIERVGIRQLIAVDPDLSICGEAAGGDEALALVLGAAPSLAVLDVSLPAVSGLDLIRRLRAAAADVPLLVLSTHEQGVFASRVLKAGARGYLTKAEAVGDLATAIHQILAGRIYLSERLSQQLLAGHRAAMPDGRLDDLTHRELEVFELLGHGVSTARMAARLGVSAKTVETHRFNIRTKLQIKDATELVHVATSWVDRL